MRIQHNIMAMNAYRNLNNNNNALSGNLEKLSSGYRINRAGDDAAGLAISEKMRAQITGLDVAQDNAQSGINLVQTAEGALTEVHDMLNRMYELAEQSANGTYDDTDRAQLQKEVANLKTEINRIADSANFNGIKLLDGSMDEGHEYITQADTALSDLLNTDYTPKGVSDAFDTKFINARPGAVTQSTQAEFVVSLDDVKFTGLSDGDEVSITVGGTKISVTVDGTDTLADIVGKLAATGGNSATLGASEAQTNDTEADGNRYTDWKNDTEFAKGHAASAGQYVEIDGNIYKMTAVTTGGAAGNNAIKFEQVNFAEESVNPNYSVSVAVTDNTTGAGDPDADLTGTINRQIQEVVAGKAVGSTQQAQVEAYIDFSKLKDGDTFNVGDKTYIFAIGKDSGYKTAPNGETVIDLTDIFKQESDLLNADKQAEAMTKIVNTMKGATGSSETWSAGNQGVVDNVGTLTFQSLSTYVGETTAATADDKYIGGNTNSGIIDMTTEASVMKQFFSGRQESGAKLSFELDVTKIKAGQTFTIDNKTFEFVDGTGTGTKGNVEIDLQKLGITGGILASQTGDVMDTLKGVLEQNLVQGDGKTSKYNITIDDNKMTLTSKDDTTTKSEFENRTGATMKLPEITSYGQSLSLQIGEDSAAHNQLEVNIQDCHTEAMGIDAIDISNQKSAQAAVDVIKNAVNYVSDVRGTLGATQNRLDHTINNLSVMEENIQDAEATIRDTDVAEEMMEYTKNNILIQSAQAMLAQANQVPQGVLQLLG